MELLPEGKQNTATEVTWEDQQKINSFSTFISHKDQFVSELESLKTEKEYLDDLSLEIELIDEDEKIQYKIGDTFVFLNHDDVIERVEKDNEVLDEKISKLDDEIDQIDDKLEDLKKDLYAKFGDNINLER